MLKLGSVLLMLVSAIAGIGAGAKWAETEPWRAAAALGLLTGVGLYHVIRWVFMANRRLWIYEMSRRQRAAEEERHRV